MTQYTGKVTLTTAWSEIASAKTTVLVQRLDVTAIELVVGDIEPVEGEAGHQLASGALKTASFDGLPDTTKVWARVINVVPEATADIIVSAF